MIRERNKKLTSTTNYYCKKNSNGNRKVCMWSNTGILPLLNARRKHNRLPCWPSRGRQVLYQRWIWGIYCTQARNYADEGSTLALKPEVTRPEVQNMGISDPRPDWGYPGVGTPPPEAGVSPPWIGVPPTWDWGTPLGKDLRLVTGVPPGKNMGPVEVLWNGDGVPSERTWDQWKYYGMEMG